MAEPYQPLETELTTLETKGETKSEPSQDVKTDRHLPKSTPDDWPVDLYRPVRSNNWTREPRKYHPSQQELMFVDRTFCQFMGGALALVSALFGLISLANYPWWVVAPYAMCVWGLVVIKLVKKPIGLHLPQKC